ncbi:uncharacterized protein RB166_012105 [Leptodactylus fuscus]|uniref:uncharacterized protein LOC142210051 n=1 Tax=Leptodactylus fuscus TaxID=238119 RepID=UPI003F4EE60F
MGTLVSRVQGLCGKKPPWKTSIAIIGPHGSGKTTILYRLKLNETIKPVPTPCYIVETLDISEDISLTIWDVSFGAKGGPLKRHFLEVCQGYLFVVDSKDAELFTDARDDLYMATDMDTQDLPFIVLANKQDLDEACSPAEFMHHLNLDKIPAKKWDICGCSAVTGEGVHEALEKLLKMIKEDVMRR